MEILPVGADDLPDIEGLRPEGWADILPPHQLYVENDFCFPFKFVEHKQILGIGTVIFNVETSWLAHIIVHPEHRRKGLGHLITDHLVRFSENRGCKSISLIATDLGKRVYEKLGFETEEVYTVYKGPELTSQNNFNIRPLLKTKHWQELLDLDREITGEDRRRMLEAGHKNGVVYVSDKKVVGYYLPLLGEGPVYARSAEAGIELIKYRCIQPENIIVLPCHNATAVQFLALRGYEEVKTCVRMFRGDRLNWKPECVFARIGGFFG